MMNHAPWSEETVESLKQHQLNPFVHAYNCGNDNCESKQTHNTLRPTTDGWVCDYCDYTQSWYTVIFTDEDTKSYSAWVNNMVKTIEIHGKIKEINIKNIIRLICLTIIFVLSLVQYDFLGVLADLFIIHLILTEIIRDEEYKHDYKREIRTLEGKSTSDSTHEN